MSGYPQSIQMHSFFSLLRGEIRIHGNREALKMLGSWMTWLSEAPGEENWEIHCGWRMNAAAATSGPRFAIIREGPDLDKFFDPEEDVSDEELTFMVVSTRELKGLVDNQKRDK